VDLPPQPSPSGIEVTCEDDPLTLEWEVTFGSKRRGLAVGLWIATMATGMGLTFWSYTTIGGRDWFGPPLRTAALAAMTLWIIALALGHILPLATATGQARLVLHPDSFIWVGGSGQIPQVYRKSEVVGIEAEPSVDPRDVTIVVEADNRLHYPLPMRGNFAPGDLPWLADVLRRWHGSTT
jgi:hypothetical protein